MYKLCRLCFPWPFNSPLFQDTSEFFCIHTMTAITHLEWHRPHTAEPHWAEPINFWGKTAGKWGLLWWAGQSPHSQHSSHHHTPSICFFQPCSTWLSWRRCLCLSVLWHIDSSTALSLCLVQWLHATQTFLLYRFNLSLGLFDFFVWLFNPYNIDIFQPGGQIKPLETHEVHIKSLTAQ